MVAQVSVAKKLHFHMQLRNIRTRQTTYIPVRQALFPKASVTQASVAMQHTRHLCCTNIHTPQPLRNSNLQLTYILRPGTSMVTL